MKVKETNTRQKYRFNSFIGLTIDLIYTSLKSIEKKICSGEKFKYWFNFHSICFFSLVNMLFLCLTMLTSTTDARE